MLDYLTSYASSYDVEFHSVASSSRNADVIIEIIETFQSFDFSRRFVK